MKFKVYLNEIGFKNYPKGWTKKSVKKFANTLSKDLGKDINDKGWFDLCVKKLRNEFGDGAEGMCAALRDEIKGTTKWRGKHKE